MTFGEAWVAMEDGKKVTNPDFKYQAIYLKNKKLMFCDLCAQTEWEENLILLNNFIFADDWEILKEPKDYKIFVDKKKNVYIDGVKLPFDDITVRDGFEKNFVEGKAPRRVVTLSIPISSYDYANEIKKGD